jgi:hypothetical protein
MPVSSCAVRTSSSSNTPLSRMMPPGYLHCATVQSPRRGWRFLGCVSRGYAHPRCERASPWAILAASRRDANDSILVNGGLGFVVSHPNDKERRQDGAPGIVASLRLRSRRTGSLQSAAKIIQCLRKKKTIAVAAATKLNRNSCLNRVVVRVDAFGCRIEQPAFASA